MVTTLQTSWSGLGLDFALLLPGDDELIEERIDALGAWCGAFLSGVGLSGALTQSQSMSDDMRQALYDLSEIARITIDDDDGSLEHAFVEVCEHVRLSALVVATECLRVTHGIEESMDPPGVKNPRIAVQALNPHGEFGTEEKDEIIPAIEEAKKMGINADGPLPCDTSFITAFKNKNHDCIVGMYHDGLQCGLKAFGFDRGVTVSGGLPIPVTTPAHGTAFDITGKNTANLEPTINSFKLAFEMSLGTQTN